MERTADEMLGEAQGVLDRLQDRLLSRLDAKDVSNTAKLPFNVLMCREVLSRRFIELSRSGLEELDRQQFAASAVLTRAVVETGSAPWYLAELVKSAVDAHTSKEINERLLQVLHGSRTTPEAPSAINVLTFVDAVDRQVEGVRAAYDGLSEMAHPNWAGTLHLFGRPDREARACVFGACANAEELTIRTAAVLSGTSFVVEIGLESIATNITRLVAICERELGAA